MQEKTAVVVIGLPLSGKTTLCRRLAEQLSVHFIDIDDGPARCGPKQEENPYRSEESKTREQKRMRVAYTILHAAVAANLEAGFSFIASATYSRRSAQEFLVKAVEQGGGKLKVIWCVFEDTPEEIKRRVDDRIARSETGGCRSVEHYLDDKARYAGTELPHLKIDPSKDPEQALLKVLAYISG